MSKFSRAVTLIVGVMALFAAIAGTAGATTWHNTGGTAVTGTGVAGTLTANGVSLTCTGGNGTATAPASSAGPTYAATGRATFTGCRLAGVAVSVTCDVWFFGTTWTSPGTTHGTPTIRCTVTGGCTVSGSISGGTYVNGPPGVGTVPASSSLTVGGAGCILGSGSASATAERFTTTSANPPRIVQP
jgi:hypothetical protein